DVEPKTRQDPELRNAVAIAYDSLGQPAAAERVLAFGPQDYCARSLRECARTVRHAAASSSV
ncbi:hypothetical protein, partial [Stenotrophomonas sp. 3diitr2024]|uniref:hypothetical protein n=1 Tax=Stenotrophomonas sp. 3diitr2024 TaxID=3345115 RepID=UPI0035CB1CBC